MRFLFLTVPFLLTASASAGWAQTPAPNHADPLAGVRAQLRQSQGVTTNRAAARDANTAQAAPSSSGFQFLPIFYVPTTLQTSAQANKAADAEVIAAEQYLRLAQAGYQTGVNPFADVRNATIALALAQIRAALAQNKSDRVLQNLQLMDTLRQDGLREAEAKFKSGIGTSADINTAQVQAMEARLGIDLYTLVTIRQTALAQTRREFQAGIATQQDVDKTDAALRDAQRRFQEEEMR